MEAFKYRKGELFCDGVSISQIAREVGTPCYVYSRQRMESNLNAVEEALSGVNHLVCYALKANGNLNLLKILADRGCGADVVSGGELRLALKAGIPPNRIVFAGVGKTNAEIEEAISRQILSIHAESFEELGIIDGIARKMGKVASVAIRVNPDIDAKTHPYITTGLKESKFGIDITRAREAFRQAASMGGLRMEGIHCHIGSMVMDKEPYVEAAASLAGLLKDLKRAGISLRYADMGGGLGVDCSRIVDDGLPSGDARRAPTPKALFTEILPFFDGLGIKILFEPGRYLIADAAALIARVTLTKTTGRHKFVVVDAGMNDFMRTCLYNATHQIVAVEENRTDAEKVSVVGPVCESGDFFSKERLLPPVERGSLLAVMATGAYGYALSSNYNGRMRPAEILVEDDSFRVIRKRERTEDLWRGIV